MKVTGTCSEAETQAVVFASYVNGLMLQDGELRFQLKVVSGRERASFLLDFRQQPDPRASYELAFVPALGWATLAKPGGLVPLLAGRKDLQGRVAEDWNTLAIRLDGENLWVLLNDELILSAADRSFGQGRVLFGLFRMGDGSDTQESAVVIRNLRVSNLAPQAR
jgi:hypothetical protein